MDGFFSQALVLLGATLVLLPLFQRLGLGSILGYLAAGIAVGHWGLAWSVAVTMCCTLPSWVWC